MSELVNSSVIGRLLEELSWEGSAIAGYRRGGRGRENVLTAEVLLPLDFLPRTNFLGQVIAQSQGAEAARVAVVREVEDLRITLLPDECLLGAEKLVVQPDAVMESAGTFTLVEAKRILQSSFQPEQLSREYLALMQDAGDKSPLMLLLLGSPPPVLLRGHGRLGVSDAVRLHLRAVHARTDVHMDVESLEQLVDERVAWTTWSEVAALVTEQAQTMVALDASIWGSVHRLSGAISDAISWHSSRDPKPYPGTPAV